MKNYILTALIAGLIFGIAGYFLHKPTVKAVQSEVTTVYKDTCLSAKLLCTITSKDSLSIYKIIREGFKSKSEKVVAKIEEVNSPTEEQLQKPLMERQYTKVLNNGIVTVWDTLTVLGTIEDWNRAYKVNDVIEVQEKTTTTTAVIEDGNDNSKIENTVYLPVEGFSNPHLGFNGGINYSDKLFYSAGINFQTKNGVTISVEKFINEKGGELNLAIPVFSLK